MRIEANMKWLSWGNRKEGTGVEPENESNIRVSIKDGRERTRVFSAPH